jgi:hypothetical protein
MRAKISITTAAMSAILATVCEPGNKFPLEGSACRLISRADRISATASNKGGSDRRKRYTEKTT